MSYRNTKPLLYGILRSPEVMRRLELTIDYPAIIAQDLVNGDSDMGLIPVATIPRLKEHYINGNYCIGAEGPVASVCLFSDVPLEAVETVLLDYQSRTSVALLKVLLRFHWKRTPTFVNTHEDYRDRIKGTTAGLVIGDRALEQRAKSAYIYDLATAWLEFTGLPFVFAAWISNRPVDEDFIRVFNDACGLGITHLDDVLKAETPFPVYDLKTYFTENISYELTPRKREGLTLFLKYINELQGK
ncbi:MAG TPA: menaquinone biosynthesis protein [Dinghuibacter sp.]|uniref:menaquinone biosynthetic enzyme MqnA/MqnD family protein n=1 Tax=Dinghuibacter sp. TaxID=2024697 RepID=UPI002C9E1E8A|nr:menaquinone biosynthesis protein [Dinghuibacter sp.]HTJ12607.1 menaquinone biosynthesis protein [Dinghuibacter sp.]